MITILALATLLPCLVPAAARAQVKPLAVVIVPFDASSLAADDQWMGEAVAQVTGGSTGTARTSWASRMEKAARMTPALRALKLFTQGQIAAARGRYADAVDLSKQSTEVDLQAEQRRDIELRDQGNVRGKREGISARGGAESVVGQAAGAV